jgi:hypothetical protein
VLTILQSNLLLFLSAFCISCYIQFCSYSASDDLFVCQIDDECTKAELWLRESSQLQGSLPKNVDPVVWSHEIKKKQQELDRYLTFLILKPKFGILSSFKMVNGPIPDYVMADSTCRSCSNIVTSKARGHASDDGC